MGAAMTWWVRRSVAAPADEVWRLLTDLDAWPRWGPTVTAARLDDGGRLLVPGSSGAVRTPLGLWLPFTVTDLVPHRSWSWRVAGVPATQHEVEATSARACTVRLGAPVWAPAYVPVLDLATRRIEQLALAG